MSTGRFCSRCGSEMLEDDLVLVNKANKGEPEKMCYRSWCKSCRNTVRCAQRRRATKRENRISRDFECVSFTTIGKELGLSYKETKSIYNKAMRKLRRYLKKNPLLKQGLRDYLTPDLPFPTRGGNHTIKAIIRLSSLPLLTLPLSGPPQPDLTNEKQ